MDELPERDRHAVLLRFFENQPFVEIGATLRLSENTARMRVERALERLRDLLAKRGIVSTSAALTALLANQAAAAVPITLATTITSAALVGGAGVTGTVGFIAFMGTTKMLSITGAVACVAAGIMLYDGSAARQVRAEQVADQQRCDSLQRELRDVLAQTEASNLRARDALQKQLNDLSGAQKAIVASSLTLDEQLLYSDPEYQRHFLELRRLRLGQENAALYKKLGLTPQQIADFEAVELSAQQAAIDLRSALFAQGVVPSDPSFKSLYEIQGAAFREERNKKLLEILGEKGLATVNAYDARPKDITATALGMDLYYSATPLTVDQASKLDDIIAANSTLEDSKAKTNWENVFDQTNGLLATPQLEALKKRVEKRRISEQMQEFRNAHQAGQS